MELSLRLQKIADFVPEGRVVADIGTDHAHLPIWLIEQKKIKKAYAMDIGEGPLLRAKDAIHRYGMENVIETRLSDGLEMLEEGDVQTVIIAGMGGPLICNILEKRRDLWDSISEFILSPQSEIKMVRKFLRENGLVIAREEMLVDMGKFYIVMKVVKGESSHLLEVEDVYGGCLLDAQDEVLLNYLEQERKMKEKIYQNLPPSARERKKELKQELEVNQIAMNRYTR
jgi:tRNA (adenine22-N1)-methyltransferase